MNHMKNLSTREEAVWYPEQEVHRRMQCRELFLMWMFVSSEGLWEEAREFIRENIEETTPFEWPKPTW